MLTADQIDFSRSVPVISSAQKYVIPIPAMSIRDSDPLVYPEGDPKAGQPIIDSEGKPVGDRGIVFFDAADKSVEAVCADGKGVIVINQVSASQAADLNTYRAGLADTITASDVKELLDYATYGLGLRDEYNSTQEYVRTEMSPIASTPGLFRRESRDICQAVRLTGSGEFQGPAASPQRYENGAVIIKQGDSIRLVQMQIAAETYTNPDGSKLDVKTISSAVIRNNGNRPLDLNGFDHKQLHDGGFPEGTKALATARLAPTTLPVPQYSCLAGSSNTMHH